MIHIWRPWKLSNFQDPPPPCPSMSKIIRHPRPWTSNFKRTSPPPPSPNNNQSIKRKHNPRMNIICYQVISLGRFSFSVSNINPVWPFFDFFHLAEASLSAISWLNTLVCAVVNCVQLFTLFIYTSFVPNCRGSNKMHQGEIYQDFLKWVGYF